MVSWATARALVLVTAVKLLLVPAYKSTDFEVHRNWLAITSQLPPSRWYLDATSRWTLDYPPLFAWFARGLAFLAPLADPGMLTLQAEPYDTPATTLFMRCTVIVSDALLALGALWITSPTGDRPSRAPARPGVTPRALLLLLVVFSPGLLMIDHVHFQYNGAASGALLCALVAISRGAPATGACIFSVLVHFKHVHVYAAPAIAAHLLAHRVGARWSDATRSRRARLVVAGRCARYLAVAVLVTAVSLGPFAREGVLGAVFSRLFPFGRGLSHAYWAPNVWALYNAADKFIAAAARRAAGAEAFPAPLGNLAGGMSGHGGTGAQTHAALPTVTPALTFALTLASCLPFIARHVAATSGEATRSSSLPRLVARTTTCAFAFGWHVHEKALLMATTPLAVALALDAGDETVGPAAFARSAGEYLFLSTTAHYAATPLLFEPREWPVKACVVVLGAIVANGACRVVVRQKMRGSGRREEGAERRFAATIGPPALSRARLAYLVAGLPLLEAYVVGGHVTVFGRGRLEFLPLALTSTYCALGVSVTLGGWIREEMLGGWIREETAASETAASETASS